MIEFGDNIIFGYLFTPFYIKFLSCDSYKLFVCEVHVHFSLFLISLISFSSKSITRILENEFI